MNSSTKFSNAILRVGDNFQARSDFSPSPAGISNYLANTASVLSKISVLQTSFTPLIPGSSYSTKFKGGKVKWT